MPKKHFVATHACFSEDGRRAFIGLTKDLIHQEAIESCKTESAEMLAQWIGKYDFFIAIGMLMGKQAFMNFWRTSALIRFALLP